MLCPLCNSTTAPILTNTSNTRGVGEKAYNYNSCRGCGLWILDPYPSKEILKQIYTDEYQLYENNSRSFSAYILNILSKSRESSIFERLPYHTNILDIGCGNGTFLQKLQQRGYIVHGTEWSESAAQSAKEKIGQQNVTIGDISTSSKTRYNAVTLWHVLEHNPDPLQFIQKIYGLLEENGILCIEVPNSESLTLRISKQNYAWFSIPEHVTYWNKQSLFKLAQLTGFEIIESYSPYAMPFLMAKSTHYPGATLVSPIIQAYASYREKGDIIRQIWKKSQS